MARKVSGKVVISQFRRTQKNGDVYVYERTLQYNPEKGYTEQVSRTKCYFNHIVKSKLLHSGTQFPRCYPRSKLSDKCRCHSRIDPLPGLDGTNGLENL